MSLGTVTGIYARAKTRAQSEHEGMRCTVCRRFISDGKQAVGVLTYAELAPQLANAS